jgi:hypothetical protein
MPINTNDLQMQMRFHEFATEWFWEDEQGDVVLCMQKIVISKQENQEQAIFYLQWPRRESFTLPDFLEVVNNFANAHGGKVEGILTTKDLAAHGILFEFDVTSLPLTADDLENYDDVELANLLWIKLVCNPPGVSFWLKTRRLDFSATSLAELVADEIMDFVKQSSDFDPQWVKKTIEENVV